MMSTHWSNHFHKFSKINWWYHSIQTFCLDLIFLWLWLFFFYNDCWTYFNIKYAAPKMSLRSAENETGKNSLVKNRVLFSKNVINFSSTFFCTFLISVNIFDNSFKIWFLILIYLIKHHKFYLFTTFISIVFWNFKIFILCIIFCLLSFIWK